jgi:hypothetical protein
MFCGYRTVEVVTLKQPHVVQELTSVLREWGHIWKHLYIVSATKLIHLCTYIVFVVIHTSEVFSS